MNSSKQLNAAPGSFKQQYVFFLNADVADLPRFCNPYQLQTSLIEKQLVTIAYNFMNKLQHYPILIYFAHFVLYTFNSFFCFVFVFLSYTTLITLR